MSKRSVIYQISQYWKSPKGESVCSSTYNFPALNVGKLTSSGIVVNFVRFCDNFMSNRLVLKPGVLVFT